MESQLQKTHDAHGHHYDEHDDALTHPTGHNEDEHQEKKSVMQKVKEKAKKLKNKITAGHGHDDEDDEDDDDAETVEAPDVHGAPKYDSAKVGELGGPDAISSHQRHNLEKPSVIAEDRHTVTKPLSSHGPTPPVSTGANGANLSEPSGIGHGHHQTSGHEVNPDKWRGKVGQPTGMEEDPFAHNPTRVNTPIHATGPTHGMEHVYSDPDSIHGHQGHDAHKGELKSDLGKPTGHQGHDAHKGELKSDLGKSTGHQGHDAHKGELKSDIGKSTAIPDPRSPKDPSRLGSHPLNYESKVTDPTHTGGKEEDSSKMQHSFENMRIGSNPKSYDPNHPENLPHDTLTGTGSNRKSYDPNHPEKLPHDTLTGNQSSKSSSNTEKIISSDKAAADKAADAKDVIASKLGYSGQNQPTGSHETDKNTGSMMDYAHVITDKVTGTLAPVYEKVVDAGSTVISNVQGRVSGTGSGTETVPPQVHHGGSGAVAMDEGKETDKGVSAKEYLVETSKPRDEDKALSDVISHALHRGHEEESEKKPGQDRPMGIVTESAEVRRRLGTDHHEEHQQQQNSGDASADKNMSERLRDAVGSWFGGKGDAPQETPGTSYVTDQGLSTNPRGDQKS